MRLFCHRCSQELPGEVVRGFCPECGAPQIVLSSELSTAAELPADSTGAPPPPLLPAIRWPVAMSTAALAALGAAALFLLAMAVPQLTPVGPVALLCVSTVAVRLYGRRSAPSPLNGLIGGKLGLVTGLLLIGMLAVGIAAIGLLARYRLHAMGPFDAEWNSQLQMLLARTAEQARAQSATQNLEPALAELRKPEFRAAVMLAGFAALSAVLLAVSTGAGALAGTLAPRRSSSTPAR